MDLGNVSSLDLVELTMAFEEAFPGFAFPHGSTPEEVLRLIRQRLGDDPDDEGAALVRRY